VSRCIARADGEVEEALLCRADAAVVGRLDDRRGQIVIAYIILCRGADCGPGAAEVLRASFRLVWFR
jgi:2-aminobenzoate-CoA ligase